MSFGGELAVVQSACLPSSRKSSRGRSRAGRRVPLVKLLFLSPSTSSRLYVRRDTSCLASSNAPISWMAPDSSLPAGLLSADTLAIRKDYEVFDLLRTHVTPRTYWNTPDERASTVDSRFDGVNNRQEIFFQCGTTPKFFSFSPSQTDTFPAEPSYMGSRQQYVQSSSTFKDPERASLRDSGHGDSDQADSDQDTNKGSCCDMSAKEALKMKATGLKPQPLEQGRKVLKRCRSVCCCVSVAT
ncbi:hypothetical protein P4O66_012800 [Electrophorus voltai]|uniref:Uncharacterized protein n=1 Tax=Electrophorus voltai TaxID=2609070 RepID=A0AAD8ZVP8_9TELE|nr:hypothetical protein P4O66_012800 [Electrophorus voltai]